MEEKSLSQEKDKILKMIEAKAGNRQRQSRGRKQGMEDMFRLGGIAATHAHGLAGLDV